MLMFVSLKRSFVNNQGCFCAFSLWTETKHKTWTYFCDCWEPENLCLKDRGSSLSPSRSRRQICRLGRQGAGRFCWVSSVEFVGMSGTLQTVQYWIWWFSVRVWSPWLDAYDAVTVAALAYYTRTNFGVSCRDASVPDSHIIIHGIHDQSTVYCVGLHSDLR